MNNETKKGKLVPELRFPGFEGEWEVKSLGEVGSTYAGLSGKSKEDFVNGNAQYITFLNVLNNVVIDNTNHPTVIIKENENQNDVKYGDLLFNTSSETPEEVGFCAMMQDNKPNIYLNSFCFGYRFNVLKDYQPLFLAYYFRSSHGRRLMTKLAQGVTRYNLSKSNFLKAEIAFPSLPEQQKIAECLSSVDDLIQAEADQLQALKDHKKGLMQQLFPQEGETTPKLRFPGFEGEWEEKKLGEVCNVVDDKCDIGSLTIVTYISTENMLQDFEGVKIASKLPNSGSFTRFNKGDILFSNIRPYLKKVWQAVFDGAASNDVIVFRTLDGYDRFFVSQVIKSDRFIAHSMSGAKGVKMPRGDKKMMLDYLFSIPSLPEQQKIAECLSSLDEGIAAQQRKVEALKEHKRGLMQKLFPRIN